jgi:hypothetical protein
MTKQLSTGKKVLSKAVPVYVTKTHNKRTDRSPLILKLGITWELLNSLPSHFTPGQSSGTH